MNITTNERARLRQAQQSFLSKTQGLSPAVLKNRLTALTNKPYGTGPSEVDPLVASLARQTLQALELEDRVASGRAELETLGRDLRRGGHRPGEPDWEATALKRQRALEEDIKVSMARAIGLRDDTHGRAQEAAVAAYRKEEAQQARTAELRAAGEAALAAKSVVPGTAEAIAAGMAARR